MKYIIISILFLIMANSAHSQPYYERIAPEIWSTPEEITVISDWNIPASNPSVTADGKRLFFKGKSISFTEKTDTGWSAPQSLGDHINKNLVSWPTISPDGNRLFFTWWTQGGWYMFYSDWDSTINDWGEPVDCGPGINNPVHASRDATLPDDTTLIYVRTSTVYKSQWDKETGTWVEATRFPTESLPFWSEFGIFMNQDRSKFYSTIMRSDSTIDGGSYTNWDIVVSYKDTTFSRQYTRLHILNICLEADSMHFAGEYSKRWEGYPTLTGDGKTMYFAADYDGETKIYVTRMLIDENGNPVSVDEREGDTDLPEGIHLYPPYPNPFNPEVTIEFTMDRASDITLSVYDILGREVSVIADKYLEAGRHRYRFNAADRASGLYLFVLQAEDKRRVQNALFIK